MAEEVAKKKVWSQRDFVRAAVLLALFASKVVSRPVHHFRLRLSCPKETQELSQGRMTRVHVNPPHLRTQVRTQAFFPRGPSHPTSRSSSSSSSMALSSACSALSGSASGGIAKVGLPPLACSATSTVPSAIALTISAGYS